MTDLSKITSLLLETILLNDVDLVEARKVLLWIGIEFMRKEGFSTEEIFSELKVMQEAHERVTGQK